MKKASIILAAIFILLFTATVAYASGIQGDLKFTAERVYYEGSTLIVYGYWYNDTNKYIPRTNWMHMNVFNNEGELVASGRFSSDVLQLEPGQIKYWKYRILNTPYKSLNWWRVDTEVNFQYLN